MERSPLFLFVKEEKEKIASRQSTQIGFPRDVLKYGITSNDLCGPMRVALISLKEVLLVIVDDYSRDIQSHQSPSGIFISQSQYAIELLKKHGLDECVSMSTPMETVRLDADLQGTPTDQTTYHRMIGGLMYLTASCPDITYATFVCARYQACLTVKHLKEDVKMTIKAHQEDCNF
ncbi:hypothetical protein Tco_0898184 [Tanacetum coccineum]